MLTRVVQAFPLKLPQTPELHQKIACFQEIVHQVSEELLAVLWAEAWLNTLASSSLEAYKVIDEKTVLQTAMGQRFYLPSRIREASPNAWGAFSALKRNVGIAIMMWSVSSKKPGWKGT